MGARKRKERLPVPPAAARVAHGRPTVPIPQTIPEAMRSLDHMLADIKRARTYEQLDEIIGLAEGIKALFKRVDDVRLHAGKVVVLASHRIGLELLELPTSKGGRPQKTGNTELPVSTLAELTGYKMKGHRLKKLASYDELNWPITSHSRGMKAFVSLEHLHQLGLLGDPNRLPIPSGTATGRLLMRAVAD